MAAKVCQFCHHPFTVGLEEKKYYNRAPLRASLRMSDLQMDCRYCRLLRQMILRFVPHIEQQYATPYVWVSLEEGGAARVEVSDYDMKHGLYNHAISKFYVYLQKAGRIF